MSAKKQRRKGDHRDDYIPPLTAPRVFVLFAKAEKLSMTLLLEHAAVSAGAARTEAARALRPKAYCVKRILAVVLWNTVVKPTDDDAQPSNVLSLRIPHSSQRPGWIGGPQHRRRAPLYQRSTLDGKTLARGEQAQTKADGKHRPAKRPCSRGQSNGNSSRQMCNRGDLTTIPNGAQDFFLGSFPQNLASIFFQRLICER